MLVEIERNKVSPMREPEVSLEEGLAKTYRWIAERIALDKLTNSPKVH
jgi:predicted transcriptional regulator